MDSLNYHDIRVEKANAILRYRRIRKITTLFRFVELFVFLVAVSRFFTQFASSVKMSAGEYFKGISVTLIGPRFVFLLGNVIVIVLFFKSGRFSPNNGEEEKTTDFYDEYVKKCWQNTQSCGKLAEKQACDAARGEERKIQRSQSENQMMHHVDERRRQLRRSVTERCWKNSDSGRRLVSAAETETNCSSYEEDGMSGEEFRRTVEAFIARQQRCLREEEEDFTAAVSVN